MTSGSCLDSAAIGCPLASMQISSAVEVGSHLIVSTVEVNGRETIAHCVSWPTKKAQLVRRICTPLHGAPAPDLRTKPTLYRVHLPLQPMLARLTRELPVGELLYEPKWDGLRCLAGVDGSVVLYSRHARPLARYFP